MALLLGTEQGATLFRGLLPRKSGPLGAALCKVLVRSGGMGFLGGLGVFVRLFFKPIDDASDASFDEGNVEVDEPPQALVGELPIR